MTKRTYSRSPRTSATKGPERVKFHVRLGNFETRDLSLRWEQGRFKVDAFEVRGGPPKPASTKKLPPPGPPVVPGGRKVAPPGSKQ